MGYKIMSWQRDFVEKIRGRESMFIGSSSVEALNSFFLGYMTARADMKLDEVSESDVVFFEGFRFWLSVKYADKSSLCWSGIIEKWASDSYSDTITAFYDLYDEYKNVLKTKSYMELKKEYSNLVGYEE